MMPFIMYMSRLSASVLLCYGLFALLPLVQTFFAPPVKSEEYRTSSRRVIMEMEVKKQKQELRERTVRTLKLGASQTRALQTTKMKFTPDLAVGSGEGVAMSDAGMENLVYEEGEVDEPARPIMRSPVTYPARAREMGYEEIVHFIILVDRKGAVSSISFEQRPHPLFRRAVTAAVKKWQFKPAIKNGIPVRFRLRQSIEFKLD